MSDISDKARTVLAVLIVSVLVCAMLAACALVVTPPCSHADTAAKPAVATAAESTADAAAGSDEVADKVVFDAKNNDTSDSVGFDQASGKAVRITKAAVKNAKIAAVKVVRKKGKKSDYIRIYPKRCGRTTVTVRARQDMGATIEIVVKKSYYRYHLK